MLEAKSVTDAFGATWKRIKEAVQPAIDAFNELVESNKEKFNEMKELWGEVMDNLTDGVINFVNAAVDLFSQMVGASAGSIFGFVQYAIDTLSEILDWL